MRSALATTLHDPDALLAGPFEEAAPKLAEMFGGVAVSLTEATDPRMERVLVDIVGARITRHPTGEALIGRGRRAAVALALELGTPQVLYADPDHALHWLRGQPDELRAVLAVQPEIAFLIVGRSERAFAAVPQRLQQTEAPINKAYELMTGRRADLLAAVRRMNRAAAGDIVAQSCIDSFANDVEWPLLAERLGHSVGDCCTAPSSSSPRRPTATMRTRSNGSAASSSRRSRRGRCDPIWGCPIDSSKFGPIFRSEFGRRR